KKYYARAQEQAQRGGPVAWCMRGVPDILLQAMDVQCVFPENYGTAAAAKQAAVEYIELAEAEGFSQDICSYARVGLGYAVRRQGLGGEVPPEAPMGGMAQPTMMLAVSSGCEPRYKWFHAFKKYIDVPLFIYDAQSPPDDVDDKDPKVAEHYIEHNLAQMRVLVDFLERQLGRELDKKALAKTLRNARETYRLFWEVHQLRRAVPSPMPSEDFFSVMFPEHYMPGEDETVSFFVRLRDEVKERVEKGIGVIPNEKHRILWGGIPMWFNMGIFNYLESLGVVSAIETTYAHGSNFKAKIDESDPVRSLVEINYWAGVEDRTHGAVEEEECGSQQAERFMEYVRDFGIDGAIMHTTRSCRAVSIGQQHTRNVLRQYLKVPSLTIETDMGDARTYSEAQVKMRLNSFIETMDAVQRGADLASLPEFKFD
ncbi:MAG TPA: 2-hydroxyacyl-CoA dehydratase family protein, partial [Dehalococcoidia bacterium]|nr:2-hydroxyacyl-CoA dehydratase family protein [Dehalococcoidia bacterium]